MRVFFLTQLFPGEKSRGGSRAAGSFDFCLFSVVREHSPSTFFTRELRSSLGKWFLYLKFKFSV
jgi:hypothetical protein